MKLKLKLISITFVAIYFCLGSINAQETAECKVLLESISGTYTGDCKNGLAHGKGFAQGVDKYEGKFKNGLPNGNGKYIWANGDYYEGTWKDGKKNGNGELFTSVTSKKIKGVWKDDNFVKEITEAPYKILYSSNVTVSIKENAGAFPGTVEIVFVREREVREFPDLMLAGSSGTYTMGNTFTGFENVIFPFEGSVKFTALARNNRDRINCNTQFKITKEGSWKVTIRY